MASKRVTLKWREKWPDWAAGPFRVVKMDDAFYIFIDGGEYCNAEWGQLPTAEEAKRTCEILAARILGAMK